MCTYLVLYESALYGFEYGLLIETLVVTPYLSFSRVCFDCLFFKVHCKPYETRTSLGVFFIYSFVFSELRNRSLQFSMKKLHPQNQYFRYQRMATLPAMPEMPVQGG